MSKPPPGTRPPATTDRVRALAEYKAGKAAANIHAFDKAAEIAGRIKDARALREALIGKLASQREFAAQCRALFSHGGDRRSSEFQDDLSVVLKGLDAFCESFGFKIRTVQRWYGLLDSAVRICRTQDRAPVMTDALLVVLVVGVMLLALAVDLAGLLGWLRRRWR